MNKSKIGVYGLGVMGQSIALNILNHGYPVSVYNFEYSITEQFAKGKAAGKRVVPCKELREFVDSLEKPRCVLLMVTAGAVTDSVIESLEPYLEKGDILIDGGNSYYKDTIRRCNKSKELGLRFIGMGVSGGEMGALNGASMMPSGDYEAYQILESLLTDIAAKAKDGLPCCAFIGGDGAGHYVKMVHNGIEYADIQIVCDAYSLMRNVIGLTIPEIQNVFETWNQGRLRSYLIEITAEILKRKDDRSQEYLVDMILDVAGQKGTGKWTGIEGLDIGVAIPTISESVFARYLSEAKEERVAASQTFKIQQDSWTGDKECFIKDLEEVVYAAKICCYAQGFSLLSKAAVENGWNLNFGDIAMIWREGCIVRADFLEEIKEAYSKENLSNLMMSNKFSKELLASQKAWRRIGCEIINSGIYAPALINTLSYFDGYRSERISANLLQAQRDFFGAHTYQRVDIEGTFHTVWE